MLELLDGYLQHLEDHLRLQIAVAHSPEALLEDLDAAATRRGAHTHAPLPKSGPLAAIPDS